MVEFSLPQPQKPVPVATIRVYFTCSNYDTLKITFRFEKDSLIHSPNKTIRQQEIEVTVLWFRNLSTIRLIKNCLYVRRFFIWVQLTTALAFRKHAKTRSSGKKWSQLCLNMFGFTQICSMTSGGWSKSWISLTSTLHQSKRHSENTSNKLTKKTLEFLLIPSSLLWLKM